MREYSLATAFSSIAVHFLFPGVYGECAPNAVQESVTGRSRTSSRVQAHFPAYGSLCASILPTHGRLLIDKTTFQRDYFKKNGKTQKKYRPLPGGAVISSKAQSS